MLVKEILKQNILSLLSDMRDRTEVSDSEAAERLATIIDSYIKSATITVPAGIPVSTTGGPAAQAGTTTAAQEALIS